MQKNSETREVSGFHTKINNLADFNCSDVSANSATPAQ